MNFSIKNKIFILVLFAILGSLTVSAYVYFINLKSYAEEVAIKSGNNDLQLLNLKIDNIKHQIDIFQNNFVKDGFIASLNLISNYQDKKNYDRQIFDIEKLNILNEIENITLKNNKWSASIFDKDLDPVAFYSTINNTSISGYTVYDHGKLKILNKDGKKLYNFDYKNIDLRSIDSFRTVVKPNGITIKKVISIKYKDETLGYLRIGKVIDNENLKDFSKGMENKISIISKNIVIKNHNVDISFNDITNLPKFGSKDIGNYFITKKNISLNLEPIYLVSIIDKSTLNQHFIKSLNELFWVSIAIVLIFLLISFIFTSYAINKPLNTLLDGINRIKNKEIYQFNMRGSDEITLIASSFSELSIELKDSFESLEKTNLFLENIFNTVHISIFIKDTYGKYIKGNKNFLEDCALHSEEQLLGKTAFDIWDYDNASTFNQKDIEILSTKEGQYNSEETLINKQGQKKIILASRMPLIDKYGHLIGVLGMYDDITIQKLNEQQLKEKEKYLLHQSRLAQMGEMISMIAHQWRQPLAAISSTTNSLMLKNAFGQYEQEFVDEKLQNINRYSQHLSSTIDDFRNFFKQNKEKKEVSLLQVVEESLNIIEVSISSKDIDIIKDIRSQKIISTYSNELRQVVLNLIKNAEDILEEKDIEKKLIKISIYEEDDKNILEISDNAGGIPEDIIDNIFEPYFSTKTNKDGTGLGLYMSKTIIEDHCAGRIKAYNNKDGAVFKIVL